MRRPEPYADGTLASPDELDLIARAFGFHSAEHLNRTIRNADRRRDLLTDRRPADVR
ncbi:hypothetical protein IU485_28340 [Nocardia cyriacigeorgica]|uniref:hypothetical protein n=1 Tax=Nocardia cyriacigeorgica TaxID=135487 RepID=UPI001894A43A|nr:hypothetical protein [Nocardia cyriacigeorgica]MBF6085283.1 hypothetical protein [Nocardia cyriacigeorgica]